MSAKAFVFRGDAIRDQDKARSMQVANRSLVLRAGRVVWYGSNIIITWTHAHGHGAGSTTFFSQVTFE